jgi:acetoin utilization deacetylase AcuC-like enzyme
VLVIVAIDDDGAAGHVVLSGANPPRLISQKRDPHWRHGAETRGCSGHETCTSAGEVKDGFRLFYCDGYVYNVVEAGWRHAFDIRRPRKIRDALIACGAAKPVDFREPHAVTDEELLLVHTPAYLEDIRDPAKLARMLLLDDAHPWDDRLLSPFRLSAGGTVEALHAAAFERAIALNLGGGFHHAQADKAEGFCAIADVAVAVRAARRRGYEGRILIVDLDYHHGNGNCLIFAADESVFTFSMHNVPWCFIEKRNNLDVELPEHVGDAAYMSILQDSLPPVLERFAPDLAVYLAGSDPHVDDLFGDADLTFEGLLERDRFVTRVLKERGVPFAVVTAGGYGPESWRVHFNYYRWLLTEVEAAR